jgi:hypothetical protein
LVVGLLVAYAITDANFALLSPIDVGLGWITKVSFIAALLFFLAHALALNKTLGNTRRVLWGIGLFLLNMLAFPLYWYLFVRPSQRGVANA